MIVVLMLVMMILVTATTVTTKITVLKTPRMVIVKTKAIASVC